MKHYCTRLTTPEQTEDIVRRYKSGSSMTAIARHYLISRRAVLWRLMKAGVKIRSRSDAWREAEDIILLNNVNASTREIHVFLPHRTHTAINSRIEKLRSMGYNLPRRSKKSCIEK